MPDPPTAKLVAPSIWLDLTPATIHSFRGCASIFLFLASNHPVFALLCTFRIEGRMTGTSSSPSNRCRMVKKVDYVLAVQATILWDC